MLPLICNQSYIYIKGFLWPTEHTPASLIPKSFENSIPFDFLFDTKATPF